MQHNGLKILVVEDNDALRKATLAFLQQEGHHVRGIAQAEEIDDILGGFVADVYVIDLNLPDEDGLSLTRRLRAAQPEVGIVIATARTQIGDRVLGYNSGADLYLIKPVDPQELRAGIRALGKRLLNLGWEKQAMVLDLKRMLLISPEAQVEMTASDALLLSALGPQPRTLANRRNCRGNRCRATFGQLTGNAHQSSAQEARGRGSDCAPHKGTAQVRLHPVYAGSNEIKLSGAQSKNPCLVRGLSLPQGLLSRFEVFVLAERGVFECSLTIPNKIHISFGSSVSR
ncbi:MAG: response regulator transcription factor [Burkholderiales bacterium]|nr:response regulator transcription factor [Burkholderiales bacterium]